MVRELLADLLQSYSSVNNVGVGGEILEMRGCALGGVSSRASVKGKRDTKGSSGKRAF